MRLKRVLMAGIRWYQTQISPAIAPRCRYIPTCSQYAMQAIEKYGAAKGSVLAARRLCRCHPFSKHDVYDPVP